MKKIKITDDDKDDNAKVLKVLNKDIAAITKS